jgi:curved DNA-binding protein CbpA
MINGKTFYQVLGVLNTAEDLVIRAAYRSLSNKYHPDKSTGDKDIAHKRMSEINAVYDTLGEFRIAPVCRE